MVMGIIMFMGKVSGAHLNPAVSVAFSLRRDFPWRRVPGYIIVQLAGATTAALFLRWVIDVSAKYGSNYPASGYDAWQALLMEAVLTLGLVSVILGTASGRTEHRYLRGVRRRRLHRPRGPVGQPDLRDVDESRPQVRARPRRDDLHRLLGLRPRPAPGSSDRSRAGLRSPRFRRRPGQLGRRPGRVPCGTALRHDVRDRWDSQDRDRSCQPVAI
jgi:hypothetical protein